jgi:hypothetical protein
MENKHIFVQYIFVNAALQGMKKYHPVPNIICSVRTVFLASLQYTVAVLPAAFLLFILFLLMLGSLLWLTPAVTAFLMLLLSF